MNETIKSKMKEKHILYKYIVEYIQNGRFESDFIFLENLITELNELISSTIALYYENLGKNKATHYCKQKLFGQSQKHFIIIKKPH